MEGFVKWFGSRDGMNESAARRYAEIHPKMVECWQAATERAAKIADDQNFEGHVDCEGCRTARLIADVIRKG